MAGRPRKDVVQSPSQEQNNNLETNKQEKTLTHDAFGMFKDANGQWCVAYIKYNPETNEAEMVDKKVSGPGKDFAIEQFKIDVANILM